MSSAPPPPSRLGAFPDVPGVDLDQLPLLLHSMAFFRGLYEPLMEAVAPASVCEIGIEGAATTRALLAWCRDHGAHYVGIDPSVGGEIADAIAAAGGTHHAALSLDVLADAAPCDVYFVDGDHNHYTVRRELDHIHRARSADDRPLVIFLHDVGWPWARRDLYYDPATVPPEGVRPHTFDGGLRPGSARVGRGGFRGLGAYAAALEEGGDDNGVLTAVEDFVAAHGTTYRFVRVPAIFGFGVIVREATLPARARETFASILEGLHWFEPLIATLERNRLDLYVQVVDQQDELVAASLTRYEVDRSQAEVRRLAEQAERATHGWGGILPGPAAWARRRGRGAAFALLQFAKRQRHLFKARRGLAGVASSLADVLPLVGDQKVVSFDIFDTLLRRDIDPPDLVHRHTAAFASDLLARHRVWMAPDVFLAHRRAAEGLLRQRALVDRFDHEVAIDDVLDAALAPFLAGPNRRRVVERIVAFEVHVEKAAHLSAAPTARETLEALAGRGHRLVAISDMYLRRAHLIELLDEAGLGSFFDGRVYVSSEPRLGKYSGRLFDHVLQAEGITAEEMIHVGDNIVSDVRAPVAKGIRAVFLRDPADEARRWIWRDRTRHVATPRDVERVLATPWIVLGQRPPRLPALADDVARDATDRTLFEIGYRHVGPAFAVFAMQAMAAVQREQIDRVYFLARDGFVLHRVWDALRSGIARFARAELPPAEYLHVSRLATSLAAVEEFGAREVTIGYWRDHPRGLVSVLASAGLDPEEFRDLFARHAITDPERNVDQPQEDATYRALFADAEFRRRVAERRDAARALLRDYLTPAGWFGVERRHALVDIGWNATIQINLARAFAAAPDAPHTVGLYFGRHQCPYYSYDEPRASYPPGLFYDQGRPDADEHAVDRFIPFLEMCACGPHGSVAGYDRDPASGSVSPRLRPYEHPRELDLIQRGIHAAALQFASDYRHTALSIDVWHAWAARRLATFIRRPTREQVLAIAALQHDLGWGTGDSLRLVASELTPLAFLRPRHTRHLLRGAAWREGSLKLTRAPWLFEAAAAAKERLRG